MERKDNMPMWVFLGVSNFESRKGPIILAVSCLLFGLGFLPLPLLLDNWTWMEVLEWSGMMFPMAWWYWLCVRWVDKNSSWAVVGSKVN